MFNLCTKNICMLSILMHLRMFHRNAKQIAGMKIGLKYPIKTLLWYSHATAVMGRNLCIPKTVFTIGTAICQTNIYLGRGSPLR